MNTKLYSELVRRKIQVPNDRKSAKIVDVVMHQKDSKWIAYEIMVESGWIDKDASFFPTSSLTNPKEDGEIRMKGGIKGTKKPKRGDVYLSKIKKHRVITTDDDELGRAYDFEIFVGDRSWIIWKILVNPLGYNPNKRRLRIPTKDVKKIDSKNIWVDTDIHYESD